MYTYERRQRSRRAEQEINLPEDNQNNSYQISVNNNSQLYNTLQVNHPKYFNSISDSFCNYTSPRIYKQNISNRKLTNDTPHHHHHHITHIHHHCKSPIHTHTMPKSRSCSCSCSCSPSPIKDFSQPFIKSIYKNPSEKRNQSKLIYVNEKTNTNDNTGQDIMNDINDNYKYNDYINNIYTQKIRDNEVSKNNNSFINNNEEINRFNEMTYNEVSKNNSSIINNNEEINHLSAKAFDEYMTELAKNKYDRMKKYNESYYLKKQFGENINNDYNYLKNNDKNLDELQLMRKNLEEKYKLYNLITKYDEMNFDNNKIEEINKGISDENSKEIKKEDDEENINLNKEINNHKNYIHIKKHRHHKNDRSENNGNYKNYERKYHKNKENDSYSSQSENESSREKNKKENISMKDYRDDRCNIQKAYDENIGKEYKNNYINSSDNTHVKNSQDNKKDKMNNKNNENNNSNLLEYLKKENEELKKLNNSYKQLLDTLFYFLNNISRPYQKPNDNSQNNSNSPKLFDLSKDLKNLDGLSQKLINLEFLMNDNKDKKPKNKNDKNNIKKSDGNNDNNGSNNDNNDNNGINNNNNNKNYIIDDDINNNNNNNKKKPLLLSITKENSIQIPEPNKLLQFKDLIEGMNEKCFSFKNDNFIERYKKINNNNKNIINNRNDDDKKNMSNIDNNINLDNDILNMINNDSDRCVACLLGCNVSKRGYSPMKYNPYMKKVLRVDDSGDLLDRYYELKENTDKEGENTAKKNINNIKKIPRSRDNSKKNILDSNKSNNSMKTQKKIWK